jgi:hypothetical protein
MEHEVKALGLQASNVKIRRQYRLVVAVIKKQNKLQSSYEIDEQYDAVTYTFLLLLF